MIKLATPVAAPVIKFVVVSTGDGDNLNHWFAKVTPVVDHERMMTDVRRAVNSYLYGLDGAL